MPIETASLAGALAAASHATNILKGITGTIKAMGNVEVMNDLIELQSAILEMQQKQAELFTENQGLKEEIKELKKSADFRRDLKFEGGIYVRKNEQGGCYCPQCFDAGGKLIHLLDCRANGGSISWQCPTCKNCV